MAAKRKSDAKPPYKENAGKPLKAPPGTRDKMTKKGGNVDAVDSLTRGAQSRKGYVAKKTTGKTRKK